MTHLDKWEVQLITEFQMSGIRFHTSVFGLCNRKSNIRSNGMNIAKIRNSNIDRIGWHLRRNSSHTIGIHKYTTFLYIKGMLGVYTRSHEMESV